MLKPLFAAFSIITLAGGLHGQTFLPATGSPYSTGGTGPNSLVVSDLNRDGIPDVMVSNSTQVFVNSSTANYGAWLGQVNGNNAPTGALGTVHALPFLFDATPTDRALNITVQRATGGAANFPSIAGGSNQNRMRQANPWNSLSSAFTTAIGYLSYGGFPLLTSSTLSNWAAAGDLNGDGIDDVVVTHIDSTTHNPIGILAQFTGTTFGGNASFTTTGGNSFTLPNSLTAFSVAVGDLNGDGKADIVVPTGSNSIVVYLSTSVVNANFTFATPVTITGLPANAQYVTIADVTGDGKADLIVSTGGNTIYILPGNNDGTFGAATSINVGGAATSTAVGDFNKDGKMDIAVANGTSVQILPGTGGGNFGTAITVATGATNPVFVAAADMNLDGKLDLVTANETDGTVSVLLNTTPHVLPGPASLVFSAALNGANPPSQQVVVNFDSGNPQSFTAVATTASGGNWLLVNSGSGSPITISANIAGLAVGFYTGTVTITPALGIAGTLNVTLRVAGPAGTLTKQGLTFSGLIAGTQDINGDGKADILEFQYLSTTCGNNKSDIVFYQGDGAGGFPTTIHNCVTGPFSGQFAVVADFNGDGILDLALGSGTTPAFIRLYFGDGAGHFADSTQTYSLQYQASGMVGGDFNNDGKMDLAAITFGPSGGQGQLAMMTNDGAGNLSLNFTNIGVASGNPYGLAAGDFNRDGYLDLVVAQSGANNVLFLPGLGNGYFGSATTVPGCGNPRTISSADFNGDGKLDFAVGCLTNNTYAVYLGSGDGTFVKTSAGSVGSQAMTPFAGDFDGDGTLDLVYIDATARNFTVALATGTGVFSDPGTVFNNGQYDGFPFSNFLTADFNGDGKLDLIFPFDSGAGAWLYFGDLASTTTTVTSVPANSATAGQSVAFTATIAAGTGGATATPSWAIPTGVVTISSNLDGQLGQGNAVGGAFTTNNVLSANVHSITATYAGDARTKASNSSSNPYAFTVSQAHLSFTTAPVSTTAGSTMANIIVKVLDNSNAVISTTSSITIALDHNSITGTATVAAVAGVATFTGIKINATGTYTMSATSSGLTTATSPQFTISAGPASKFLVAGFPNPATVNLQGSFTVTAQDAGGNTVTGYTGTAHFTSSDGLAVLPANYTFTVGDSGVHTFNATLKTVGTQSITATDTVTSSITGAQTGIVVQVGAASGLTPNPPALAATVGSNYGAMSVRLTDTGNNPISGQTITFTAPGSGASGVFGASLTATAVTDETGVATLPTFTANTIAGTFNLHAAIGAVSTDFSLTNTAGAPTQVTVQGGNNQSTAINTAYPTALSVLVQDAFNNPVAGASVTFTMPGSGASATFPGSQLTSNASTNSAGIAIAQALTANGIAGVIAGAKGGIGLLTASFNLTNLTGAPAHISITAGNSQSTMVGTAFATLFKANVTDSGNNALQNVFVTFTAPGLGASGTFPGSSLTYNGATDASGNVTALVFTANTVAGTFNAVASVSPTLTANVGLTNTPGPAVLSINGGNNQSAVTTVAFSTPLSAKVADSFGNPYSGTVVTFTAPGSGASGAFANATATTTATTGANGVATASTFTANGTVGTYSVGASAPSTTAVNFSLSNITGPPANVLAIAGTPQTTLIGTAFGTAFQAKVTDLAGNPLSGVLVTFAAVPASNGATGAFGGTAVVTTNASGLATSPAFTANSVAGSYTVKATAGGISGNFNLTNTPGPAVLITASGTPQSAFLSANYGAFSARVTDASSNPLSGLSVTFTVNPVAGAGGTFPGAASTATVTTDANGTATAPTLTANASLGAFTVTAKLASPLLTVNFNFTNLLNPPAALLVVSGSQQNTQAGTGYGLPLTAKVVDASGAPLNNVSVTFTAPSSGPSANFGGALAFTGVTNSQGLVVTPAVTANQFSGTFTVVASTAGLTANFVLSIGGPPALTIDQTGFFFRYDTGTGFPPPQTANVDNALGDLVVVSDSSWVKGRPLSTGGLPYGISVSVDPTGLAPGNYFAILTLTSANRTLSVRVNLVVIPKPQISSAPNNLTFRYLQGSTIPPEQLVTINGLSRNVGFTLATQQITAAKVNWLNVVSGNNATTTPAILHISVTPVGIDAGTYQGVVHVIAPDATNSPYDINVTLIVTSPVIPPVINSIVNAASFQGNDVSGNEILAMFGTNLGCAVTPQVLVDGVSVLVLGGTATQVNWVAPDLTRRTSIGVQFACGANTSAAYTMKVVSVIPGIFTSDGKQVSAYNAGFTLNGPAIPIGRGKIIMLFGTGFGPLSAPDGNGLQSQTVPVTVTVGGIPATLTFAGAAPGLPGVNQINVLIPDGAPTGTAVPLVTYSGGTPAPTGLTVAIN